MQHQDYVKRLAAGLRESGCTTTEGVHFEGRFFSFVARRSRLAWIVVVPMFADECFIAMFTSKLTREKMLEHIKACGTYAVSHSPPQSLLNRMIGGFATVYAIVLAEEATSESLDLVRRPPPLRSTWPTLVPVVLRLSSGEVTYFEKCPVMGGAVYREMRKVIAKVFAG